MMLAFEQAEKAAINDEVPVGCVISLNNKVISFGRNKCISKNSPLRHAEIEAIESACNNLKNYRLPNSSIYVTLEPCAMCMGALYWSQLDRIVYAASDPKRGALAQGINPHPKSICIGGIMQEEATYLLQRFFQKKRQ